MQNIFIVPAMQLGCRVKKGIYFSFLSLLTTGLLGTVLYLG